MVLAALVAGSGAITFAQTATPGTKPNPPTAAPATIPATTPPVAVAPTGPSSKITFASKVHNFGKSSSGQMVRHDFIFTNTGTATLEILEVKPQCGCTTAGGWDKTVEPGKTGIIPLQLNPHGLGGTISKTATVTCNDPTQGTVHLQITGTVWKPVDITPTMASFIYQDGEQTNQSRKLRIVNNTEAPLTISDIKSSHDSFKAELSPVTPGKEFELLVTAVPPFTNRTAFGTITMKTSATNMPQLTVSTYASVQFQVTVMPEQLNLPPGPLTNSVNTSVTVRNTSSNALTLSDVMVTVAGATVQVQELQPGKLFTLRASFPPGTSVTKDKPAEITAKSNHPRFPVLHVPIVHSAAAQGFPPGTINRRALSTNAFLSPRPGPGPSPGGALAPTRSPLPAVPNN
jgi:Protein of unknown function (DUF1573)